MQTLLQVICSKGTSLRDAIINDKRLGEFGFVTQKKLQPGRPHGWAKLRSNQQGRLGALNIEWDADTSILLCRVVNRGTGRPNCVLGDFVEYLFQRFRRRIQAVNIIPR
jgi:hypothetical protein